MNTETGEIRMVSGEEAKRLERLRAAYTRALADGVPVEMPKEVALTEPEYQRLAPMEPKDRVEEYQRIAKAAAHHIGRKR